jgi:transcriptional regulator with XRE-family HTH domain
MKPTKQEATRAEIARKVRALREKRGLTQAELSKKLGMSQSRVSGVERGDGSFSAEQFVEILRVFNVTVGDLVEEKADPEAKLHNALARLGASHLVEDPRLLPSEQLEEVESVIKEVLIAGGPARQVTALAPVLIQHVERLNLGKLWAECKNYGIERRLAWLIDSTLDAVQTALNTRGFASAHYRALRKAEGALRLFLKGGGPQGIRRDVDGSLDLDATIDLDIVGPRVTNEKTLRGVIHGSSVLAQRWGVATAIQPNDFYEAVRVVRADTR